MRRLPVMISAALLSAVPGFAETMSAGGCTSDGDILLGAVVDGVKAVPSDTKNLVNSGAEFFACETQSAIDGVKSIMGDEELSSHDMTKADALQAIADKWDTSNDIQFRSYNIASEVGEELVQGMDVSTGESIDVSSAFSGVEFSDGTSVYYRPDFKKLFVRQTMDNILVIEDVLAEQHNASRELMGQQVEIQTKFVEVSQSSLNELGFRWQFSSSSDSDASLLGDFILPENETIFTDGLRYLDDVVGSAESGVLEIAKTAGSLQWSAFISALEQQDDSDVLSAPRVVTRDGSTAIIQVGEERMIPKAFEANNQNSAPFIEHSDWELELMGVNMEVTPELLDDGLIGLEIHPVIKEIVDYDSYTVVGEHYNETITLDMPELAGSLPAIRLRELETRVTIEDGSTIGMGGLIYDKVVSYKDSVPVLGSIPYIGRLFRSEGESVTKRNLMIFVTATEVDINGRKGSDLALKK